MFLLADYQRARIRKIEEHVAHYISEHNRIEQQREDGDPGIGEPLLTHEEFTFAKQ